MPSAYVGPQNCPGQLNLVCDSCEGQRIIQSDDTAPEVCSDCGGTGIDPDAAYVEVVVRTYAARKAVRLGRSGSVRSAPPDPGRPVGRADLVDELVGLEVTDGAGDAE